MKLPDVNVLLYATNAASPAHEHARDWLTSAIDAAEGVGFAWIALVGFLRLSTKRGIFETPLRVEEAIATANDWFAAPRVRLLEPAERHWSLLSRLLIGAGTAGNLTNDAHLASIAIEHGATLVSYDRDFERFAGLDFELLRA